MIAITSIFVGVAIQAYNIQPADAASAKKYQIVVTLTDVPPGAADLIVNASITSSAYVDSQEKTITSPSSGDVVKFVFTVPSGSVATHFIVCGNTEDFTLSTCNRPPFLVPLPTKGVSSPIRVDYAYPT